MRIPNKQEIENYFPEYLQAHKNTTNIFLHCIGNIATLTFVICILLHVPWYMYWLLLFSPFIVYPFAWAGHFYFEKNKPATFTVNPIMTKICDWKMMGKVICGEKW